MFDWGNSTLLLIKMRQFSDTCASWVLGNSFLVFTFSVPFSSTAHLRKIILPDLLRSWVWIVSLLAFPRPCCHADMNFSLPNSERSTCSNWPLSQRLINLWLYSSSTIKVFLWIAYSAISCWALEHKFPREMWSRGRHWNTSKLAWWGTCTVFEAMSFVSSISNRTSLVNLFARYWSLLSREFSLRS